MIERHLIIDESREHGNIKEYMNNKQQMRKERHSGNNIVHSKNEIVGTKLERKLGKNKSICK